MSYLYEAANSLDFKEPVVRFDIIITTRNVIVTLSLSLLFYLLLYLGSDNDNVVCRYNYNEL